MASEPSPTGVVTGRLDAEGRLIKADPPLLALQTEAGAKVGERLALPQVAAIARLARELGVPVARAAVAAGEAHDYDLWVRATLQGDEIALDIEGWRERPAVGPRLDLVIAGGNDEARVAHDPASGEWATDADLKLTALALDLAGRLEVDRTEAIGQPLTRYFKLEEDEEGALPILAALAARIPFVGQRARARSHPDVALLLSAEALHDAKGAFAGFAGRAVPAPAPLALVPSNDAGEDDSLSAELDRALRSPLDHIIAAADRIVDRTEGPLRSDYAGYAADIAAAGRHLLSVIQSMGDGAPEPQPVDLAKSVQEAIGLVTPTADERRIAIDFLPIPLAAKGDARGVVQILVNILGNAVRYSPEGSRVMISLATGGGRVCATVADEGPGIAPDDQQKIFERFERLDQAAPGTGLGLGIARRLARSMGGDILVESAPGEGARFMLDLPAA